MIQVLNGSFRICQDYGDWDGWGWGCLRGLDDQVREAPVQPAGQPPVGVAEEVHRRGNQHGAPVEAHMLFGGFEDKTTVNLCWHTHHEPA